MTNDRVKELLVGLKSIQVVESGDSKDVLAKPIAITIEPLISRIWLPTSVCTQMEQALGLKWNQTARLYFINEAQHEDFLTRNITFKFTLSDTNMSGEQIVINFPYEDLVLHAIYPLTDAPSRYLPIQRALIDSQIVLGRVFLQATYMTADYDRRKLNISQAMLEESSEKRLYIISPPPSISSKSVSDSPVQHKRGLSSGAIAGIIIGIASSFAILAVVRCIIRKRRSQRRLNEAVSENRAVTPPAEMEAGTARAIEKEAQEKWEVEGTGVPSELPPVPLTGELAGDNPAVEMEDSTIHELDGSQPKELKIPTEEREVISDKV
jgi:hypothetical protein